MRQMMPCSCQRSGGRLRGVSGSQAGGHRKEPSNLSFEEAASVPVASQTAWQGIFTHGHLEKGQTILIHGVPAQWVPMRCNWHRMPVPPSLSPQAATMRHTSTPSSHPSYQLPRGAVREGSAREGRCGLRLDRWRHTEAVVLVLKEGGHLVSATQPVSHEETAMHVCRA